MTLTAGQLAPLAASAKTEIDRVIALPSPTIGEITAAQVEGFDDSSVSYATLRELLNAKHAGYDMGIDTFDGLDTHIQVYVNNSALLNADNLQLLRFITMPSRIRAVREDNVRYFDTSQEITIPENCYLVKVSFQAAGGDSGRSQRGTFWQWPVAGGGGGGGAAVIEYEIAVTPNEVITLTKGDTLTFGALTVEQGGNGENYYSYNGRNISGGVGGRVLWNGLEVDNGVTAIAGGVGADGDDPIIYGGSSTLSAYTPVATTSNGKLTGGGGGVYVYLSANNGNGNGGGASPSSDGLDGLVGADNIVDTRNIPVGTGAPSPVSKKSSGSDVLTSGGPPSPTVMINFVQQQP